MYQACRCCKCGVKNESLPTWRVGQGEDGKFRGVQEEVQTGSEAWFKEQQGKAEQGRRGVARGPAGRTELGGGAVGWVSLGGNCQISEGSSYLNAGYRELCYFRSNHSLVVRADGWAVLRANLLYAADGGCLE